MCRRASSLIFHNIHIQCVWYENVRYMFTVHSVHSVCLLTHLLAQRERGWHKAERVKRETNIKRSFRLPHVKRPTIIHVIIMLILCWHWNSFPFIPKTYVYTIFDFRKLNFYSSNFLTVIFLVAHRYHRPRWNPIPHNSLNVLALRFRYIYVNFNRTLCIKTKPGKHSYFSSFSFFLCSLARASLARSRACVRAWEKL